MTTLKKSNQKKIALKANNYGVIQYPKADARRLFVLMCAIDSLDRPTMTTISEYTGHNKGTIEADVAKLNEQFGVSISKTDAVYKIESWGEILKQKGVKICLTG